MLVGATCHDRSPSVCAGHKLLRGGLLGEPPCYNTTRWSIKHTHRVSTQKQHTGQSNTQSFHSNTTQRSNRATHGVAFETHLNTHIDHFSIYVESGYLFTTSNEKKDHLDETQHSQFQYAPSIRLNTITG